MAPAPEYGPYCPIPKWVLARTDLLPADKLALAAIVDIIGENGECWCGQRYVQWRTGVSLKIVHRAIANLQAANLIIVERRNVSEDGIPVGPRADRTSRMKLGPAMFDTALREEFEKGPKRGATPNVPKRGTLPTVPDGERTQTGNVNGAKRGTSNVPKRGTERTQYTDSNNEPKKRSAARKRDPGEGKAIHDLIAHWAERYKAAIGANWQSTGKAVGQMKAALRNAGGNEARVRAAIDTATSRAPPFPFNKAGGLTVANLTRHFEDLENAAARASNGKHADHRGRPEQFELPRL